MQSQIHSGKWDALPGQGTVDKALDALNARGFKAEYAPDRKEALAKVVSIIPEGAALSTAASRTLEEIGFTDLLKSGDHGWVNMKKRIVEEEDRAKQLELRRGAVYAPYFLGSVHAVTLDGELVVGSASGSQLAAYAYGGGTLILVVGTQKLVPDLAAALERLRSYSTPLEDARMKEAGFKGTVLSKTFIYEREHARPVHVILVGEKLGF